MKFTDSINKKLEKKKRIESNIEVLKKKSKVAIQTTNTAFDQEKASTLNNINIQIGKLKAKIEALEISKGTCTKLLEEQQEVAINKIANKFNLKVINQQNKVSKYEQAINAEVESIRNSINNANLNNSSKRTLNESVVQPISDADNPF
ncbi:hypothetical protein [uncultured Clostridium sp.]|uniref:hypothetical protein n=1 Tax=uncultured Clostridium sp. TaxID=59620 RepID=UPI0026349D91|nr:hypothetical protein [uncultured Clostridium sp.]